MPAFEADPGAVPTAAPGLAIEDVSVKYGAVHAVRNVSFAVPPGTVAVLLGANGAGKSSLLGAVMGLVPTSQGRIWLTADDGSRSELTRLAAHVRARHGIALAPEGRGVFGRMSVRENLEIGGYLLNGPAARSARAEELLGEFPRLGARQSQLASTLSGGEQQMLAIARALMTRPRYLLLDEPSLGLAPVIVRDIIEIIREVAGQGTAIVLVEQNSTMALELADHAYVLNAGRLVYQGHPTALQSSGDLAGLYLHGGGQI